MIQSFAGLVDGLRVERSQQLANMVKHLIKLGRIGLDFKVVKDRHEEKETRNGQCQEELEETRNEDCHKQQSQGQLEYARA